jgi:hypothetical protein
MWHVLRISRIHRITRNVASSSIPNHSWRNRGTAQTSASSLWQGLTTVSAEHSAPPRNREGAERTPCIVVEETKAERWRFASGCSWTLVFDASLGITGRSFLCKQRQPIAKARISSCAVSGHKVDGAVLIIVSSGNSSASPALQSLFPALGA